MSKIKENNLSNSTRILLASTLLVTSSVLLITSQSQRYRTMAHSKTAMRIGADYWLAIKAMGIGTLLAIGGVGMIVGTVSKVMRVERFDKFGERMRMWMGGSRPDVYESEQELQRFFNNKNV